MQRMFHYSRQLKSNCCETQLPYILYFVDQVNMYPHVSFRLHAYSYNSSTQADLEIFQFVLVLT